MAVGYENASDRLAYASNMYCQLGNVYDVPPSTASETKARTDPFVPGFHPGEGREKTQVTVHIRSDHELLDAAIARASLSFATANCPAEIISIDFTSGFLYAVVTSEAPSFAATGSCSPHVPMCVRLQDDSRMNVSSVAAGYFRYTSHHEPASDSIPMMLEQQSRSASATCGSTEKRVLSQQLPQSYSSPIGHCPTVNSPYSYRIQPRAHDLSPRYSPYESRQPSFRRRSSTMSSDTTSSSMPCTPRDPGWASSYTAINGSGFKAASSLIPSPRFSYIPKTSVIPGPTLIRTTQIADAEKLGFGPITSSGDGTLVKFPSAELKIDGYLDGITTAWTLQENMARRRLVEFWRSQNGGVVKTSFAPVDACTKKPNTVSCILWERKDGHRQYVITSVDIIRLLDFLIDCQTDTNEKNRIRRNVDKFDAKTTSKEDPETGALFNLIMGFSEPKPRHIAKPVKVFPWSSLGTAVKKVIEKFTPDYWGATEFLRANAKLSKGARAPTSQPQGLLKGGGKAESEDDMETNESPPHRPHSTCNSAHSRSQSSAYSTSGLSCASSTTSPNLEHTVRGPQSSAYSTSGLSCASSTTSPNIEHTIRGPQPSGTSVPYTFLTVPDQVEYASSLYSYPQPDVPSTHVSMVAGHPVRGSWDFSALGTTPNHLAYNPKQG
ncbi:MAG: hypothetical protein Q9168_000141 [Polycauliona sp. 1 TL-2023]